MSEVSAAVEAFAHAQWLADETEMTFFGRDRRVMFKHAVKNSDLVDRRRYEVDTDIEDEQMQSIAHAVLYPGAYPSTVYQRRLVFECREVCWPRGRGFYFALIDDGER